MASTNNKTVRYILTWPAADWHRYRMPSRNVMEYIGMTTHSSSWISLEQAVEEVAKLTDKDNFYRATVPVNPEYGQRNNGAMKWRTLRPDEFTITVEGAL